MVRGFWNNNSKYNPAGVVGNGSNVPILLLNPYGIPKKDLPARMFEKHVLAGRNYGYIPSTIRQTG